MKRTAALSLLLLALSVIAAPSFAADVPAKKAPTHEALWLMKRVGTPSLSPDGKWVAFSVTEPAYEEKEQSADLWLVPADGSATARRVTFSKPAESDVTWSPDSHRLAFVSKREGDETSQIYVLDIAAGGEAQRITNISTGARQPQFSPDGRTILFVSSVYPGSADDEANKKIAKERKEQKYKVRTYDSFPVRQWDRWLDDQQVHLFTQSADGSGTSKDLLAGTDLVKQPGFSGRPGEGSRDDLDAAWTPDGKAVVFVATTKRNTSAYAQVPTDVYVTNVSGGEPRLLTKGDGEWGRPQFSPDGSALFATYSLNNKLPFNGAKLVRFDWPALTPSIAPRPVTGAFDRSVGGYVIASDSKVIYFTAEDAGLEKLYAVPTAGGEVRQAIDQESGVYGGLSIASKAPATVLVANWSSSINPAEVVRIDPITKQRRNLTSIDVDQAAAIDWTPPRHFWFTNKDGMKIHNMVIVPPGFDETKKYPLLVLMHGGAANMWRDQISLRWNYHLLAKPGYVMLMTDYRGSTGYGDKFAQAIQGDPLKGPGDDINAAADEAIKRFAFIDGTRQAAAGASYGGHLANWMEATTTRYKCIIAHAGLVNLESQWGTSDGNYHRELMAGGPPWEGSPIWKTQSPIHYAAQFKTPILLSVGEHDFRVPMNETLENWSALQRMQVPSRLLVWPNANHWILDGEDSKHFYKEVADWLAKWM